MSNTLLDTLKTKVLVLDGAMGTQLQAAGLEAGACGEAWNIDNSDVVCDIHRRYVNAGSKALVTNSFGATTLALKRHGEEKRCDEINRAAVTVARQAFGDKKGFVLGDIGPFGGMMEPYGEVSQEEVKASYRQQAQALVGAGADAIIIETQTSLDELELAVRAAQEANATCVIASMAFDLTHDGKDMRTMMGVSPEQAMEKMIELNVDVAGFNCGTGIHMDAAVTIAKRFSSLATLPLIAQPNAGDATLEGSDVVYHLSGEEMASSIEPLVDAGVRLIGACCGSTPEHISCFSNKTKTLKMGTET